jgi:hypothetical protein
MMNLALSQSDQKNMPAENGAGSAKKGWEQRCSFSGADRSASIREIAPAARSTCSGTQNCMFTALCQRCEGPLTSGLATPTVVLLGKPKEYFFLLSIPLFFPSIFQILKILIYIRAGNFCNQFTKT